MKKILWFSNCAFTRVKVKKTGTWLLAMGEAINQSEEFELYNISQSKCDEVIHENIDGIIQYLIPIAKINKQGIPDKKTISLIQILVNKIKPDLIHIWGTEMFWGTLPAKGYIDQSKVLLDMQGVLSACERVFYGGLTNIEIISSIGLKELLMPNRVLYIKKRMFKKRARIEQFIIDNIQSISVQSDWVNYQITTKNPAADIYRTGVLLRKEFYIERKWTPKDENYVVFTSISGSNPFKGLHVLFRAMAELKKFYPSCELIVAGPVHGEGMIEDGYTIWLQKEIRRLSIQGVVKWLGPLNVDELIEKMMNASCMVIPSYVESYSLTMAESMIIGVPTVSSYVGAMAELGRHNESVLYFPVGDYISCFSQIRKIFEDKSLAEKLSIEAKKIGQKRNNRDNVVRRQFEIYDQILNKV